MRPFSSLLNSRISYPNHQEVVGIVCLSKKKKKTIGEVRHIGSSRVVSGEDRKANTTAARKRDSRKIGTEEA